MARLIPKRALAVALVFLMLAGCACGGNGERDDADSEQLEKLLSQIEDLETAKAALEGDITDLEGKVEDLEAFIAAQEELEDELRADKEALEGEKEELEDYIAALTGQIRSLRAAVSILRSREDSLEDDNKALKDNIKELEDFIASQGIKVDDLESLIDELEGDLDALKAAYAAVKEAEKAADELAGDGSDESADINAAWDLHDAAYDLVTDLPDSNIKDGLYERLTTVLALISSAWEALDPGEEVSIVRLMMVEVFDDQGDLIRITAENPGDDPLESEENQVVYSGRVVHDGTPIKGAQVVAWQDDYGDYGYGALTDADGYFEFTRPPGDYRIQIRAAGYKTLNYFITLENDSAGGFYNEPAQNFAAQALPGMASLAFSAEDPFKEFSAPVSIETASSIPVVALSFYEPQVMPEAPAPEEENGDGTLNLEPLDTYSVTGTITDSNDEPVGGAWVTAWSQDLDYFETVVANAQGQYSMDLPDGEFLFWAGTDEYSTNGLSVIVNRDIVLDRKLEFAGVDFITVTGQITDVNTGEPVADVQIAAWSHVFSYADFTRADGNGNYSLELPPGSFYIFTAKQGYFRTTVIEEIDDGNNIINLELEPFSEMHTLHGKVLDLDGSPVPGARVYVDATTTRYWDSVITDRQGQYSLELPYAEFYVYVFAADYLFGRENVWLMEDTEFDLYVTHVSQGNNVSGVVRDSSGDIIPGAEIVADGGNLGGMFRTVTNASGYYEMVVIDGEYDFRIQDGVGHYYQASVAVDSDMVLDWNLNFLGEMITVSGIVMDHEDLQPLRNAWVQFYHSASGFYIGGETNMQGHFTLELPEGNYDVGVYSVGYLSLHVSGVPADDGRHYTITLQRLPETVPVQGYVFDDDGNPVQGASVEASHHSEFDYHARDITKADGSYTLHVPPQQYKFFIYTDSDGLWPFAQEVEIVGATTDLNFYFEPVFEVSGIVYDPDGQPAIDALLKFEGDIELMHPWSEEVTTDATGHYSILLPAQDFKVEIFDADDNFLFSNLHVDGETEQDWHLIAADQLITVTGRIADPDGVGLGRAYVSAWTEDLPDFNFWVETNHDGTFEMRLPQGEYYFSIDSEGYFGRYEEGVTIDGEQGELNWELTPAGANIEVAGQVTCADTGEPLPYVWVDFNFVGEGYSRGGQTNSEGFYQIFMIEGLYDVFIHNSDWEMLARFEDVEVYEGEADINFSVTPPVTVSGQVTDLETSEGIADVWVTFGGEYYWSETWTDGDGYYNISVPPGYAYVEFEHEDYYRQEEEMEIYSDNGDMVIDRELVPYGPRSEIYGQVTDSDSGDGVEGLELEFTDMDTYDYFRTGTDGGGYYSIQLTDGTYRVRVYWPEYNYFSIVAEDFVVDGEPRELDVEVTAPDFYSVSGRITYAGTGDGLADVIVDFYRPEDGFGFNTRTDEDGYYSLYVAEEIYNVWVGSNWDTVISFMRDVEIDGEDIIVDVEVVKVSGRVNDASTGDGISGVFVYFYNSDEGFGFEAWTDGEGYYTIYVAPGMTDIYFEHDDYANYYQEDVELTEETTLNLAMSQLAP